MVADSSDQQTLHQAYRQLTAVQKSVAQVFALLYEPTNRENARKCWNYAIADRSDDINDFDSQQFGRQVQKLLSQEILTQAQGQGSRCNRLLVDIVVREAVNTGSFEPIADAIAHYLTVRRYYARGPRAFRRESEFMRELRIAIYREDSAEISTLLEELRQCQWRSSINFPLILRNILTNPFDPDWFSELSDEFFRLGFTLILDDSVKRCVPAGETFELLEDFYHAGDLTPELRLLYAEQLWLRGFLDDASEVLANTESGKSDQAKHSALLGAIAFLTGSTAEAIAHYHLALTVIDKSPAAQADWFNQPAAVLFFLALLEDGSSASLETAEQYISLLQQQPSHWLEGSMTLLLAVLHTQQGKLGKVSEAAETFSHYALKSVGLPALIEIYSLYWLDVNNIDRWFASHLPLLCQKGLQAGYGWLALETAELLVSYQPESIYTEIVEALREQADSLPLITVIQRKAMWELSLTALTNLVSEDKPASETPAQSSFRLVWRLLFRSATSWSLTPLEQKLSVRGGWTKGKSIALKRLLSTGEISYMTAQDQQICNTMEVEYEQNYYRYRASTPSYFFTDQSLLALVGHPLVFWEDAPNVRVDVVAGEPELLVKRLDSDRLQLELSPPIKDSEVLILKETPTRLKVISVGPHHQRIAELLGSKNRLEVPAQAEERVLQAIASIASLVTVQSDIGGGVEAEEVPADATPHVHLLPAGEGLKVSMLAHPFPAGGSYYPPGQGGETVIAEVEGTRMKTQRDLKAEKKNANLVSAACPVLQQYQPESGEWMIDEPSDCLELLLQLQALSDQVKIEWPEGERFRVSRQLGINDFKFDIHRQQDWFAASGEVQISEDRVIDLQQLMSLLASTPGQFIPLADGEFLALTDEFRQRLQTLGRLSQSHGKEMRIHGLAALAMDEMLGDVDQLKVDQEWKDHIKHIQAARTIEPEVPRGLQATLRDYQKEGYLWLARLANWGVGACLADDMGLGKTLQGLAVILSRSSEGPTLVVAPTSVCMNWTSEAERFAPDLQVKSLGEAGRENRQQLIDDLEPNDLLVCSYGLIQQEDVAEMLAVPTWRTIVLDEAQAIKNPATKRSQAVMSLQGSFKIIMTGTPIENHLGELWNLFRFINPGLLGSLDSFNQRFANPIERDRDDTASDALRRMIRPFILRRTKDQVLKELPSRTEITLPVELSKEEMAFYEALRREAVTKLTESDAQAGQKHLQVLAEIMRLRRACCNPDLVSPEMAIPSTKLEQFGELLSELLDNGHKALVFSQFVDHLKILRAYLDKQQITYQYLDGSTPAKQRKVRVDAFQNGEGDVFLISLKAGGTGLNLTAADYVLHMDPWWNPAVEDQASDRAHRIGQQRPVTIYRLVAKGTIEDKIVALHKIKRDLADSLLTGSDVSSKVSTDELLSLIQQ